MGPGQLNTGLTRRQQRSLRRQEEHHQARIRGAGSPSRQLKAACEWLVAEARRLGTDQDATDLTGHVLDLVAQLRATTAGRLAASRQAHRDAAQAAMQKGPGP